MKPRRCSVMITPPCARTTCLDSRRMTSTKRGSLPAWRARRVASGPAVTSPRSTRLPSALLTIFCAITRTSPSCGAGPGSRIACTRRSGNEAPGRTSGMPVSAVAVMVLLTTAPPRRCLGRARDRDGVAVQREIPHGRRADLLGCNGPDESRVAQEIVQAETKQLDLEQRLRDARVGLQADGE